MEKRSDGMTGEDAVGWFKKTDKPEPSKAEIERARLEEIERDKREREEMRQHLRWLDEEANLFRRRNADRQH